MRFLKASLCAAVAALAMATNVSAGGLLGLHRDCCDSAGCDTACCEADSCDACCEVESCSDSCDACGGCDATCGCSEPTCGQLFDQCCDRGGCGDACDYISLFGGWNILDDYSGEAQIAPARTLRGTFNDGWAIGVAKGRRFNCVTRGEIEYAFRDNTGSDWLVNGVRGNLDGRVQVHSIMANIYREYPEFCIKGWSMYSGAGLGIGLTDGTLRTGAGNIDVDDEVFAYQFIFGANKPIHCNVDVFAEYRAFRTSDLKLRDAPSRRQLGEHEIEADNIFFGLRFCH